jgi:hypothetical protein
MSQSSPDTSDQTLQPTTRRRTLPLYSFPLLFALRLEYCAVAVVLSIPPVDIGSAREPNAGLISTAREAWFTLPAPSIHDRLPSAADDFVAFYSLF